MMLLRRSRRGLRAAKAAPAALVAVVALAAAGASMAAPGAGPLAQDNGAAGLLAPHKGLAVPALASAHARGRWLHGFTITEYWPTPESWFVGKRVRAPGLPGRHRIDWLYSARGVSMEGEGIGLDGRMYHLNAEGNAGWVTAAGRPTCTCNEFAAGAPFWRAGAYWRNRHGAVTFPLAAGGWYAGRGRHYVPLPGISFAPGPSLPLRFYRSIAVDPNVIPLGSRVYIPAYQHDGHGGWFVAQDTGGAIDGRRIDVYRRPPASPDVGGRYLASERVYVIKP